MFDPSLTKQAATAITALLLLAPYAHASPYADFVVSYDAGVGGAAGYDDPTTALGAPSRTSGGPSDVTVFNSPFQTTEIVSIGDGGHLTVRFDAPVVDDPLNPFGIDLLVFGNAFFGADFSGTNPTVSGLFADPATISVSADGVSFFTVPGVTADGLFPTQGFRDTSDLFGGFGGANDGTIPTDFTRPVDPSLTIGDLVGLEYIEVIALYAGAGGGAGVDLASVGLESIQYVRIDGIATGAEIDGFADVSAVPEPGTALLTGLGLALLGRRRRAQGGSSNAAS